MTTPLLLSPVEARVLATLIRLLGDFDRAEEAMHDAFIAAALECQDLIPD